MKKGRPFAAVLIALSVLAVGCGAGSSGVEAASADGAIEEARRHAEANPKDAAAAGRLARLYHSEGAYDQAREWYEKAAKLDGKTADWPYGVALTAVATADYAAAIEPARKTLELEAGYVPAELALARSLLETGKVAEAEAIYKRLTEERFDLAEPWYGLARCRLRQGDAAGAVEAARTAVARFPQYGAALDVLARTFQSANRPTEAQAAQGLATRFAGQEPPLNDPMFDRVRAVSFDPEKLSAYGQSLLAAQRYPVAIEVFNRAAELAPESAAPHLGLLVAHARMGDLEKSEAAYARARELEPNNGQVYYNYGVLAVAEDRPQQAREAFEKAIEINPGDGDAWFNLGVVLEGQGETQPAIDAYLKAAEVSPTNRLARYQAGVQLLNQQRFDEALTQLEQIQQPVDQQTPMFLFALAMAQGGGGDLATARQTLQSARNLAERMGQQQMVAQIDQRLQQWRR